MGKHVISAGNITDGFQLVGPFESFEKALKYCETEHLEEWHIHEMLTPEFHKRYHNHEAA